MERILKNKTVVITGGAMGIGYHIADKYLEEGAKTVIILDVNEREGMKSTGGLNAKYGDGKAAFIKCDVTKDLEEVSQKVFNEYKQVDVLVNNAGITSEKSIRKIMEINVIALVEWSMKFFEHMRKDRDGAGGTIINMGSGYSYHVDPYLAFYKATKHAVMGFTRTFGHQDNYQRFGVRAIILCPGLTNTTLGTSIDVWDEHRDIFPEFVKSQAVQEPEVVGEAAVKIFEDGESGSAWKVFDGKVNEVPVQPIQLE